MAVNRIWVISIVLTFAWMMLMSSSVKPLTSKKIVAFEFAKTQEAALFMMKEWKENNLIAVAKKSIYLDFVFLVLYSLSISLGCLVLSGFTGNRFLIQMGLWVSKIVPLAGLCDVVENGAMLTSLSGNITRESVTITYWFAAIKFLIVVASLIFLLVCMILGGIKRALPK